MTLNKHYWSQRYKSSETAWDIGEVSPPLRAWFDQLDQRDQRILIPGCGNAWEAAYLWNNGFKGVNLLDWSEEPLQNFAAVYPDFPAQQLINANFFDHRGVYDIIVEQTFFCAIDPSLRKDYARHANELLAPGGKVVGLLFDRTFEHDGPPFGGNRQDYRRIFEPHFRLKVFESCYNSLEQRQGSELFMILEKK